MGELQGIFVFFTYADIIKASVKPKASRCEVYEAIFDYAKTGNVPKGLGKSAEKTFQIILPLIKARREADIVKLKDSKRGKESAKRKSKKSCCNGKKSGGSYLENNQDSVVELSSGCKSNSIINDKINNKMNIKINMNRTQKREINKERKDEKVFDETGFSRSVGNASPPVGLEVPSESEIDEFIKSHSLNVVAGAFYHYYNGKEWKIKGEYIDWREKLLEWHARKTSEIENVKTGQTQNAGGGYGVYSKRVRLANERDFSNKDFESMFDDLDNIEI